jgi:hypothetical protein
MSAQVTAANHMVTKEARALAQIRALGITAGQARNIKNSVVLLATCAAVHNCAKAKCFRVKVWPAGSTTNNHLNHAVRQLAAVT